MNEDLIRRGDVKTSVCKEENADTGCGDGCDGNCYYMTVIDRIPAVDAVEVVRCHKCVHWDEDTVRRNSNDATWWNEAVCCKYSDDIWEAWKDADWFCADGERKTDE